MDYTAIIIIFNPNSTGPSGDMAKALKRQLEKSISGLKVDLHSTKYAGHARKIAYDCAKASRRPLIISSSGDGGYNEVINGAIDAQAEDARPTCAVLPAGNANDHCRTLQDGSLFDAIVADRHTKLDLLELSIQGGGKSTSRYAHSYIGLGLTPVVAVELNKTSLNAMRELWIILKTFAKLRPFKIKHAGKIIKLDSILFANIGQMAKILTVAANARPDDGQFEVVTFPHGRKFALIRKLLKASAGGVQQKKSYKSYRFTSLKRMPVQLDGEVQFISKDSVVTVKAAHQILRTIL